MSEDNKWYVLRVISGKEKKLRDVIEKEIKLSGWSEVIPQVIVPTEKVYKLKGGKKVFLLIASYVLKSIDLRLCGEYHIRK